MNETNGISDARPLEGATTDLPHDRMTVQRFRDAFPRARWSDRLNAWFVPGRTAAKRIGRWLAEMEAEADRFADEKGRDAFAFEPIESRYLDAAPASLQIRTPYSRTITALPMALCIRATPRAWGSRSTRISQRNIPIGAPICR